MTSSRRLTVAFRTLGCKVNQVESERIAAELTGTGCVEVPEPEASVVIVNTCTVTGEADRKARKEVRRALGLPQAPVVVVTGCLAALDADGLRSLGDRVVVETDKAAVARRVGELLAGADAREAAAPGERPQARREPAAADAHAASPHAQAANAHAAGSAATQARAPRKRTRAQVLVEDGCDAYCSYCIVPYARGVPRAVPLDSIVAQVRGLTGTGTSEVVLTGINIGRYRDSDGADLADVIRAVATTGIPRIRLSSVEPLHLPGRLLEALATTPGVCPHLHLPLQAGSDRVLEAMDRGYDTKRFAEIVHEAREAIPGLAVSTDVMVGFPGETPADAIATCGFVEACGFSRLHVFRYSRRPGTLAAEMPGQVDPRDKQVRSERLRGVGERLARRYAASRVGGDAEVLVERVVDGVPEGTSEDYLRVRLEGREARPGELVAVRLTGLGDGCVLGA